jgi:hypothetical protein
VCFFDDADRFVVASRTDAIEARVGVGDVVADRALADFFLGVANGVGKGEGFFGFGTEQMEGQALGRFLADTREMFESVDESFNWGGKIGHG